MTEISATDFRAQFPDLAATDAELDLVLPEAIEIHSVSRLATLFCAAHLIVFNQQVAAGSIPATEVASRTVGPLSSTSLTQAEKGREAFFTSTPYGRRFLTLEKRSARSGIGALVVG